MIYFYRRSRSRSFSPDSSDFGNSPIKPTETFKSPSPTRSPSRMPTGFYLSVRNLTRNVSEAHLREIFGVYGEILGIVYPMHPNTGYPTGKAVIEYTDSKSLEDAITGMNGGQIDGNVILCSLSNTSYPQIPTREIRTARKDTLRRGENRREFTNYRKIDHYVPSRNTPRTSRSPLRRRNISRSRSPMRRRELSRSPIKRRSIRVGPRSPVRRRSISRSPDRRFARSPARRFSRSPARRFSRSRSPVRRISRSPARRGSKTSVRKFSRSPSPVINRSRSRSPRSYGRRRRSLSRSRSRSPLRRRSPSYSRSRSPIFRRPSFTGGNPRNSPSLRRFSPRRSPSRSPIPVSRMNY